MLFNSVTFIVFFAIVFVLYWQVFNRHYTRQNLLILMASYVFYGFWDWRFLSLIAFSSLSNYYLALVIEQSESDKYRRHTLWLSTILNLGLLGFFKYYHFFTDNLVLLLQQFGFNAPLNTLHVILPVGISFYTFQTMSYTIDVYRRQLKASQNAVDFCAYVAFFPQLVAGPIERARNLLPQFNKPRVFSYGNAVEGLKQALWGLFQKVVIADNCAPLVNEAFTNPQHHNTPFLIAGAVLFAFQVYGDFAGYTNMAIGLARLLGFNLMQNFAAPYFSENITEMWRRWHISLSTWLRDYLFTPLAMAFRNLEMKGIILATILTFSISGLWHGANWNFIFWGFLHGLFLSYALLTRKFRKKIKAHTPLGLYSVISIGLTFTAWTSALIFFRSADTTNGFLYYTQLFKGNFGMDGFPFESKTLTVGLLIAFYMLLEYFGRKQSYAIQTIGQHTHQWVRWSFYAVLVFLILVFYPGQGTPFIYFQF